MTANELNWQMFRELHARDAVEEVELPPAKLSRKGIGFHVQRKARKEYRKGPRFDITKAAPGLSAPTIHKRLDSGWSIRKALSTPPREWGKCLDRATYMRLWRHRKSTPPMRVKKDS